MIKHPAECPWHRDWHLCNCGLFDTITWAEPGRNDEAVDRSCSGEEAAEEMIQIGHRRGYEYASYKDALEDFIVVHWAKRG